MVGTARAIWDIIMTNCPETITLPDGSKVPTPRLRNGIPDADAIRRLQNYVGPTALQVRDAAPAVLAAHKASR